jgi:hypothetical protein
MTEAEHLAAISRDYGADGGGSTQKNTANSALGAVDDLSITVRQHGTTIHGKPVMVERKGSERYDVRRVGDCIDRDGVGAEMVVDMPLALMSFGRKTLDTMAMNKIIAPQGTQRKVQTTEDVQRAVGKLPPK